MVLSETWTAPQLAEGHVLAAPETPPGRRFNTEERKVVLWSRQPWTDVDQVDLGDIDRSRFVTGLTTTPIGVIRVVGICIPWHMAKVRSPVKQPRAPWELHREFLRHLVPILEQFSDEPYVVAGDFNQRVPRVKGGNLQAAELLSATFNELTIATQGVLRGCERPGIDHIAHSRDLSAVNVWGWPAQVDGVLLSDHDAAVADLMLAD